MSAEVSVPQSTVASDEEWRRLSPRMLLVHPVKEVGRAIPALLAVVFAGSSSGNGALWGLVGAAIVVGVSISRWFTTRYRVGADQVQIREGLLRRRTLAARLDRVRTVDVTSHFLHRSLGLARVEIGTGVSDRKGRSILRLDGLPTAAAARLRGELLHRSAVAEGPVDGAAGDRTLDGAPIAVGRAGSADDPRSDLAFAEPAEVEIARLDPAWIRFAPFTLSGIFTGLAVAGFGWRLVSESHVDLTKVAPLHDTVQQVGRTALWLAVLEVAAAVVLFVGLASTARYVLAYWNFRLTRHAGGTFHVSRGLVTTRATSIDVNRLRGVGISQPLPLRMVRGARTVAIATGLDVSRGAAASGRASTVLLPDAPLTEARRVADAVIGRQGLTRVDLVPHGSAARQRRFTRALGIAGAVVAATALSWWALEIHDYGWLASLVLLPLAVLLAADRSRNLGHLVRDGVLVTQFGSLSRRRVLLDTDAIIGWNVKQSFFQRRAGVATLTATTAAGRQSYRIQDLPLGEARRIADEAVPGLLTQFSC